MFGPVMTSRGVCQRSSPSLNRTISIILVLVALTASNLAAQPQVFDTFDGTEIHDRWTVDSSTNATATVEPTRKVLVFNGPEHEYNHIETPLPKGAQYVQTDVCLVNDTSASWSPSLILYWDETNYSRLMFSSFYSLNLEAKADGEPIGSVDKRPVQMGRWYRGAIHITDARISFYFGQADGELSEVGTLDRPPSWDGQPTLIVGKGHMPDGGNPDFDNNYGHDSAVRRTEFDNVLVGDSAAVEEEIANSMAQRVAGVAHDPASMEVAFWPNITHPDTIDTLWFAPDVYQRLCLIYNNTDPLNAARDFAVQLRLPGGVELQEVSLGDIPVSTESVRRDGFAEHTIRTEGYAVPADHHGISREDETKHGWFRWPVNRRTPSFFIHCIASAEADGKMISARALAHSGAGPWQEMEISVVDPLPELVQTTDRDLGLSLWGGLTVHPSDSSDAVADRILALCRRLGIKRLHTNRNSSETVVAAARAHGIVPFLTSWWHYSWQNTTEFTPTETEAASESTEAGRNFCPVIIAEGSGTYGGFLQSVTQKMRESDCEGFMLDYECSMPLCYCERCREAFADYTGLDDVNWPEDVRKDGRYYRQWIDFRCHQGALYVRSIRDAAREAVPDCAMQAWVAGYDYNNTIETATIDVSKADDYLTEVETPHYTLPADYSDMWTEDAGIGSVEAGIAAVEDTLPVVQRPVIFCSSLIYPLGSKTLWSDPRILDVQIQTIIAAGARGVSFWGGHFYGAIDGRYMHNFLKWHNLLAAAGDFLWEGQRDDSLARIDEDPKTLRRFVWTLGNRRLLALTNLTSEDKQVRAIVEGCGTESRDLLTAERVDLSEPISIPALDGVFLLLDVH